MIQEIKLELGGKKRVFTFGLTFLGEVMEKHDPLTLEEIILKAVKFPAKYVPSLMFESLRNTALMNNETVDFTQIDIIKWLEKENSYGADIITEFLTTFLESTDNKTKVEDLEVVDATEVKKK